MNNGIKDKNQTKKETLINFYNLKEIKVNSEVLILRRSSIFETVDGCEIRRIGSSVPRL